MQVVGPDPGYKCTWLVPSHPGKTGLVFERPNVCSFAETMLPSRMRWKSGVVIGDSVVSVFPLVPPCCISMLAI